jgi:hypothetical protein
MENQQMLNFHVVYDYYKVANTLTYGVLLSFLFVFSLPLVFRTADSSQGIWQGQSKVK